MCETPQTCKAAGRAGGNAKGGFADVRMPLKSLHQRLDAWVSPAEETVLDRDVVAVVQTCCDLTVTCPELLLVTSQGLRLCRSQPCVHHRGRKCCSWADLDFSVSCNWYFLRFLTGIPLIHQYLFHPQITRFFEKEVEHLYSRYKEGEA